MNNLESKTVVDFLVENIASAEIFSKYGINFTTNTHSNVTLHSLCLRHYLEYEAIIAELNSLNSTVPYLKNYNAWDLDLLIQFLTEIDHPFKKDTIVFIENLANKMLNIHGKQLTELESLVDLIQKMAVEIEHHIDLEEKNVFPYILYLNSPEKFPEKKLVKKPYLASILEKMNAQHKKFFTLWFQAKNFAKNYQLYADLDSNFKLLFYKLKQFEEKLQNHIHIEHNILFPKALELEKKYLEN